MFLASLVFVSVSDTAAINVHQCVITYIGLQCTPARKLHNCNNIRGNDNDEEQQTRERSDSKSENEDKTHICVIFIV